MNPLFLAILATTYLAQQGKERPELTDEEIEVLHEKYSQEFYKSNRMMAIGMAILALASLVIALFYGAK